MQYIRLSEGLNNYKLLPDNENVWNYVKTNDKDYYTSIFKYNEEHYKMWKATGKVAGIKDVTTSKLFFDFDNKHDLEKAKEDTIQLVIRLISHGFKEDNIQVAFTGNKGFSVEVETTDTLTQQEFKNITFALASNLESFDTVVNDPNRLTRLIMTRHPESGLYKIPLTMDQLTLPISEIKAMASSIDNIDETVMVGWVQTEMPESIGQYKKTQESKKVEPDILITDIDLSKKPKWLTEAKYALQEGYFSHGDRNTAFMILGATYKAQGFPKEIAYRMLKGVAEIQAKRTGEDEKDSDYIWNNIIGSIYSPTWRGATYSYENTPLLQKVTSELGLKVDNDNTAFVPLPDVTSIFKRFAEDIDNNTIKLGIESIDRDVRVTTSMLVGLLAAPSAGKTSISLNILNTASKNNIRAGFFSLDMGAPLVYQRLIQKHTGMSGKKIFELYKNKDKSTGEFEEVLNNEYKNVSFCFKSGISAENIREFVTSENNKHSENPMRLLVVDYLECVQGPYSDSTANTSLIAQQLKDIANDLQICIILLLQPQKHAGDPSAELLNYRQIKGSSAIEQAASVIFTISRPGFSAKNPQDDRYMSLAVVKNRMGSLGSYDFMWDGITGTLQELDEMDKGELNELRARKEKEKIAAQQGI